MPTGAGRPIVVVGSSGKQVFARYLTSQAANGLLRRRKESAGEMVCLINQPRLSLAHSRVAQPDREDMYGA
jgi:hypothetical protein